MPSRVTIRGKAPSPEQLRSAVEGLPAAERQSLLNNPAFQSATAGQRIQPAQELFKAIRALQNGQSVVPAQELALQAAALLGGFGLPGIEGILNPGVAGAAPASRGMGPTSAIPWTQQGASSPVIQDVIRRTAQAVVSATHGPGGPVSLTALQGLTMPQKPWGVQQGQTSPVIVLPGGMGVRASGAAAMAPEGVTQPVPNAIDELKRIDVDIRRLGSENLDRIDHDIRRLGVTPAPPAGWQLPFGGTAIPSFVPPGMTRAGGPPAWVPPGVGMGGGGGGGGGLPGTPGAAGAPGGGGFGWGAAAAGAVAARGLGLGRTASLLGRMAGGGVELGLAAGAAWEIATLPQHMANIPQALMNAARAYVGPAYALAGYSRAGGFGYAGMPLLNSFYAGNGLPTAELRAAGMTPADAVQQLQTFGIVQSSVSRSNRLAVALGTARFMPGFSGLPDDTAAQFLGRMTGAGMIPGTAGGAQIGVVQVSDILSKAVTLGMDRVQVLQAINSGVQALIGAGAMGGSMARIGAFLTGFPAEPGKSGQFGLNVMGQIEGAVSTIGTNPLRTLIATQFGMQFHAPAQLQAYMQKNAPGLWQTLSNSGNKRIILNNLTQAVASGNPQGIAYFTQQLLQTDPRFAAMVMASPAVLNLLPPGFLRTEAAANILGTSAVGALDVLNPAGAIPDQVTKFLGGLPIGYNKGQTADYTAALGKVKKLSSSDAALVMSVAATTGVDPRIIATLMGVESTWGTAKYDQSGRPVGVNVMQISSANPMPTTRQGSIIEGAQLFKKRYEEARRAMPNAPPSVLMEAALIGYSAAGTVGETAFIKTGQMTTPEAAYIEAFNTAAARMGLPNAYLGNVAATGAATMGGAVTTYAEIGQPISNAVTNLQSVVSAISGLIQAFLTLESAVISGGHKGASPR